MSYSYWFTSKKAYNRATEFEEAAILLNQNEEFLLPPIVVNAAFSCELYLKAILYVHYKSSKTIRGHELFKLFQQLPEEFRNSISTECWLMNFDLGRFFNDSNKVFDTWRYIHETDDTVTVSINDLLRFSEVLKKHIETVIYRGKWNE